MHLVIYFSCLFSAPFEHTDDSLVVGQGGAGTPHVAIKLWHVIERINIDTVGVTWFLSFSIVRRDMRVTRGHVVPGWSMVALLCSGATK